jgi:hypothetical protein
VAARRNLGSLRRFSLAHQPNHKIAPVIDKVHFMTAFGGCKQNAKANTTVVPPTNGAFARHARSAVMKGAGEVKIV